MKVLFDYQIFALQKIGGISRYFFELLNSPQNQYSPQIAIQYHRNQYLQKIIDSKPYPQKKKAAVSGQIFPGKGKLLNVINKFMSGQDPIQINQKWVRRLIAEERPDIFHPTYYSDYFLDDLKGIPFILTVYDMIHELFPEHFIGDSTSVLKRKLLSNASHIIAISETTKRDIIDFYGCDERKISVVHLANSIENLNAKIELDKIKIKKKFLLFIGQRKKYKNFLFFASAVSKLLEDADLLLICTGTAFNKYETDFIDYLGISHRVLHIFANDVELAFLYKNAEAFIFPSLYEGFGIPVLEAFACDCPVLASRTGSLPEIGDNAAIYFDPKSASEISNAVINVISNPSIRDSLILKGRERLKYFSWEKTIEKTGEAYQKCLAPLR